MNSMTIANIISIILMSFHCLGGGCSAQSFSGMDFEQIQSAMTDEDVSIYKRLAEIPTLLSARIGKTRDGDTTVETMWSKRNLDRLTRQKFTQNHRLNSSNQVIFESFLEDVSTELLSTTTDDNEQRAVLRQTTTDRTVKQYIEVHYRDRTMKHYDLSAFGVHDDVYTDSTFASFEWSPDRKRLLYIAEKKLPQSKPFYSPSDKSSSKKGSAGVNVTKGNQYVFKPDWGDGLAGKHQSVIVVLDYERDTVTVLSGVPDEVSPGQVQWALDGQGVVGVAWKHEPRYLGLRGSLNVHSWIFLLENGKFSKISNDGNAVWSPRLSIDRTRLVWMERNLSMPQLDNYRLMATTWNELTMSKPEIIIDIVDTSITISNGNEFSGLYLLENARRCWSSDSKYLFLSTPQYATMKSYVVNIETKVITEIENGDTSLIVLDAYSDWIAFETSSPVSPDQLVIARFDPSASNLGAMDMIEVTTPSHIEELKNLDYKIVKYTYDNDDEVKDFNFVYFGPRSGEKASTPLILWPHGGPQSVTHVAFRMEAAMYAYLGYGLLIVNYRGSTGMGAANLLYLLGNVGVSDVEDMVTATEETLLMFDWLDSERIGCYGGSYGGFIVAHLTGQHPMLCKAAVIKSPLIHLPLAFDTSDVPDGFAWLVDPYHYVFSSGPLSAETYAKMYECSPIVHVLDVIAPTMICVGSKDLRAPMYQGLKWFYALEENGVKAKLLVYEDNHSLSATSTEVDRMINAWLWFKKYLSPDPL